MHNNIYIQIKIITEYNNNNNAKTTFLRIWHMILQDKRRIIKLKNNSRS